MIRGNQAFQKAANAALVLRHIRQYGPVSRTDIAEALGLTKSTVTNIVAKLFAARLLEECDYEGRGDGRRDATRQRVRRAPNDSGRVAEGAAGGERWDAGGGAAPRAAGNAERAGRRKSGGRPRRGVACREGSGVVVGFEIRRDGYRAVALDLAGNRLGSAEGRSPARDAVGGFEALLEQVYRDALPRVVPSSARIVGAGFGLPAYVDPVRGRLVSSTLFECHDEEIVETLSARLGVPVLIDNDANCAAWGELAPGPHHHVRPAEAESSASHAAEDTDRASARVSGRDPAVRSKPEPVPGVIPRSLLTMLLRLPRNEDGEVVSGSVGVGFGVVIDRKVHYGADFAAGEFRSVFWRAGNPGQLAAGISQPSGALVRELLTNLSVVISLIRPERVAYAGDLLDMEDELHEALSGELGDSYAAPDQSGCPVVPARAGVEAVAHGAAVMFQERLLAVPALGEPRPHGVPSLSALLEGLAPSGDGEAATEGHR